MGHERDGERAPSASPAPPSTATSVLAMCEAVLPPGSPARVRPEPDRVKARRAAEPLRPFGRRGAVHPTLESATAVDGVVTADLRPLKVLDATTEWTTAEILAADQVRSGETSTGDLYQSGIGRTRPTACRVLDRTAGSER